MSRYNTVKTITALRVLEKITEDNACVDDIRYIKFTNNHLDGFHPSTLGAVDSTGFRHFKVPTALGGNSFGDIPLQSDDSVKIRIPAGKLIHLQGIDNQGQLVKLQSRVFSLPPGHAVDLGVKASQYHAQCGSCHGQIESGQSLSNAEDTANLAAVFDADTIANSMSSVNLMDASIQKVSLTFKDSIRPILDAKCISCHSGESAAGELSLQKEYSVSGNYPKGTWQSELQSTAINLFNSKIPLGNRVESLNFSVPWGYALDGDYADYLTAYSSQISSYQPLGSLAPWDSGYQNLFRMQAGKFVYINGFDNSTSVGRVNNENGNSRYSFLMVTTLMALTLKQKQILLLL